MTPSDPAPAVHRAWLLGRLEALASGRLDSTLAVLGVTREAAMRHVEEELERLK